MGEGKNTERLLRLKQFIPDRLPISVSGWWAGVKTGKYPPGRKLSARVTVWPENLILAVVRGEDWREVALNE